MPDLRIRIVCVFEPVDSGRGAPFAASIGAARGAAEVTGYALGAARRGRPSGSRAERLAVAIDTSGLAARRRRRRA